MKQDRLFSYMSDNFYPGRTIYRGNKFDNEILKRNVGKEVPVSVAQYDGSKYRWSQVKVVPVQFLKYDDRHENFIPEEEKAFSKKHGKMVPNRFAWEIEPL
jgi:hypothetical protein